ncbi:hypothetical protein BBK14_33770 [Parafrankia soli]|uniref:Uncharacterized protein n=1 Tax=Parafrankia soli TaxID=2599596 RepID=A0A1S1QGS6_9ACTN|nr:hypothetical protein [Parafrankia soli]OHV32867.1 hypothetical protein BBK14_33770 [Parafrankia soli]
MSHVRFQVARLPCGDHEIRDTHIPHGHRPYTITFGYDGSADGARYAALDCAAMNAGRLAIDRKWYDRPGVVPLDDGGARRAGNRDYRWTLSLRENSPGYRWSWRTAVFRHHGSEHAALAYLQAEATAADGWTGEAAHEAAWETFGRQLLADNWHPDLRPGRRA